MEAVDTELLQELITVQFLSFSNLVVGESGAVGSDSRGRKGWSQDSGSVWWSSGQGNWGFGSW